MSCFRGHDIHYGCQICVDCGMTLEAIMKADDNAAGDLCAQQRVLRGRPATEARQLAESEMRRLRIDDVEYHEYKIYRGALCVGTRYRVADPQTSVGNQRQGEEQ